MSKTCCNGIDGLQALRSFLVVALWLLLGVSHLAGAVDSSLPEESFDCRAGCRKVFKPACGADGRTYASPCLAKCQGVQIAHHGPCEGETVLHPSNCHVVTDTDVAGRSSAVLTPRHLEAFAHEGYRYAGQLTLTGEPVRPQARSHSQRPAAGASPTGQQSLMRAMRVTREGHMYMADMDETVAAVLDDVISRNTNASDSAEPHVHALLHNLRQWRDYRAGGGAGGAGVAGNGGSKWKKGAAVGAGSGDAVGREHTLVPGLVDAKMAGSSAGSGIAAGAAASGGVASEEEQRRQKQKQAAASKAFWSFWGQQRKDEGQDSGQEQGSRQSDSAASTAGGLHSRQARRSLGIFDGDDRVDCPRTPTYPFTAVGQINVRDSTGNYVCSGALVGPDVVLTAAHCVFNRGAQTFYDKLDFAPARYRTLDGEVVNPFGVVPWSYVTVYQSYSTMSTADPNVYDVAVIKLSQRIGSQAGWMGVFEPCNAFAPSRYVALTAGYPSDQPPGSCKTTQCVVVQEPCTDGYLYHKCDTASGQSGSPMWMMAMTSQRKMGPYVRAVHNIEWVQEMPNGKSVSYINSAVSVTPDHYRSILAWIAPSFDTTSTTGSDTTTPMGPALPPPASSNGGAQYSVGR
ncbi:hypothetical protein HYH02_011877 [Chlamydomonas schloesseri]|uniref:Serine protease n=1 Tax=Chlamydomonas schloesseri TaxID=2026947 RepID=A0A835W3D3_9CHLO|nr:hypothetical protein HYH02_011877 [Chlamydomonas schloesseri]|eukprot:KAG2435584.1 hypothetical protein HYH02_011877 [Chlamydomonas schloesseri]